MSVIRHQAQGATYTGETTAKVVYPTSDTALSTSNSQESSLFKGSTMSLSDLNGKPDKLLVQEDYYILGCLGPDRGN